MRWPRRTVVGAPRIHGELRLSASTCRNAVSRLLMVSRHHRRRGGLLTNLVSAASMDFFRCRRSRTGAFRRRRALLPSTAHSPYQHHGASYRRVGCATVSRPSHDTAPRWLHRIATGSTARPSSAAYRHGHRRGRPADKSLAESVVERAGSPDPTGCLDHVIVVNEPHLGASSGRTDLSLQPTHLGLDKDTPDCRPPLRHQSDPSSPCLKRGGLHHCYERRAA